MNLDKLMDLYQKRGIDKERTNIAIRTMTYFDEFLKFMKIEFVECSDIDAFLTMLVEEGKSSVDAVLALARFFYLENNQKLYVHLTKYLGGLGVIDNIKDRISTYTSESKTKQVFEHLEEPPVGTSPKEVIYFTEQLINRIEKHLSTKELQKCLAGNNHSLSKDRFLIEKEIYENFETLDLYLTDFHQRRVLELEEHLKTNTVWFEQVITQRVIDFVKHNQEILSAKRVGNKLYVTKIPYDTEAYLDAKNDIEKAYFACHCPFARESVLKEDVTISGNWCYCSGGFQKYMFDVIFGRELSVKVLNNALDLDGFCRFEIDLNEIKFN